MSPKKEASKANKNHSPSIALIFLGRKGGGPVYSYEMAKGLINNGCNVYIFISKYVENIESWLALKAKRIEIIKTYKGKFSFITNTIFFRLFKYKSLRKKYRDLKVDACYIPMGHPWDCYIVNSIGNPQKILTIHDPIEHTSNNNNVSLLQRATSILNKGIFDKKPDDLVILSKCFLNHVKEQGIVDASRVHVVPHGVFDFYKKVDNGNKYSYRESYTNFLFFGRIDKYKGIDVLAKAFLNYQKINPSSTLTVVGSGDFSCYTKLYENMENVTIINRWIKDEEVCSFFNSEAKLFLILPYIDATQSGVVPISMAMRIPVLASRTGGMIEQIEDNVTGLLFNPNDADDLTACMLKATNMDMNPIVEKAFEYIDSLSWDKLSRKIMDIVEFNK